jgi:sortase A
VLRIGTIGLNVSIYTGTADAQLQKGAGQILGTGSIGEIGSNAVLAGHRRTFFRNLDRLQPGDEITVETEQGLLRYQVYKIHIVEPTDVSVLNRSRRHSLLTLVTCHPLYTSKQRLIVHAYLKSSE